jgi:hypothetical protein
MPTLNLQVATGNDDSLTGSGTNNAGRNVTGSATVSVTDAILPPGSHEMGVG